MNILKTISSDLWGICRVCGVRIALRWLSFIVIYANQIFKQKNLQPADLAMGNGPFLVKNVSNNCKFLVAGEHVFSGIREMYVRDTYLKNGLLQILDGDVVVDLGANMGNFTNLALSCGKNIKVVAVEPSTGLNNDFINSVMLNDGYLNRIKLLSCFVGNKVEKIEKVIEKDKNYQNSSWISEEELIKSGGLKRIDFLKCDIEGAEFGLLTRDSRLLQMANKLAIEIHSFAGNVEEFLDNLKNCGFVILHIKWDIDGTCTALARKTNN